MTSLKEDRPKVALYGLVRTKRERLLFVLSRSFCVECGWERTEYVDNAKTTARPDSAWERLLADIAERKYYAVVMFQDASNMDEYCQHYDTHFALIHPDTSALPPGSWRSVQARR